jgi:hypothetical protein
VKALAALALAVVALMPAAAHAGPPAIPRPPSPCDVAGECGDVCAWLDETTGIDHLCGGSGSDVCVGMDSDAAPIACAPAGDEIGVSVGEIEQIILTGPHHG